MSPASISTQKKCFILISKSTFTLLYFLDVWMKSLSVGPPKKKPWPLQQLLAWKQPSPNKWKMKIHIVTTLLNNGQTLTIAESLSLSGWMMLNGHLYIVVNIVIFDVTDEDNPKTRCLHQFISAAVKLINTLFPFSASASDTRIIHPTSFTDGLWTVALRQAIRSHQ